MPAKSTAKATTTPNPKSSLLNYFKPKISDCSGNGATKNGNSSSSPPSDAEVKENERSKKVTVTEAKDDVEEMEKDAIEAESKSPASASISEENESPVEAEVEVEPKVEEEKEEVEEEETKDDAEEKDEVEEEEETPISRRPTRACANRARKAWNDREPSVSSSDDDDDFQSRKRGGGRKRGRSSNSLQQSASKRSRQTTLSLNGKIVKENEKEKEKKKSKRKSAKSSSKEVDPEREAFLRSGVPDVIEKAKAKRKNYVEEEEDDEEVEFVEEKVTRRILDPETLAFLHSGVPDSVIRARQNVEKRKEQNELLQTMGFFPRTSHTCGDFSDQEEEATEITEKLPFKLKEEAEDEDREEIDTLKKFSCLSLSTLAGNGGPSEPVVGLCCEKNLIRVSSIESRKAQGSQSKRKAVETVKEDTRPWIDIQKVTSVKNLVVDKTALETLTRWVKQWKMDIKDDGGTSRKLEKKRKRGNSSDSDFVTSDEGERGMKKKSVLLTGPSGCGKTTAVYVLAEHCGFEVVEVNFSSRRSGKEVLQRVEEAVLSHRLESSQNCLLLFKDIDLVHPEEDEGFFSAVVQLITTAVRPIVMTTCLPVYCLIDSRLDRKDPLRISFSLPKPKEIVEKVLKPILASTKNDVQSDSFILVDKWLDSIVRHAGCDIRQSINQLQLLLSTSSSAITSLSNEDIHLYSSPFQSHLVDLDFPRQGDLATGSSEESGVVKDEDEDEESNVNLSLSARNKRSISQLDSLSQSLAVFADLDFISSLSPSCPLRNVNIFGDMEEAAWYRNHVSGMRSPFFTRLAMHMEQHKDKGTELRRLRELVLEGDKEVDTWMEIDGVNDEIGQYCDGGGGWENCAAVRTIVKNNLLDSAIGRVQKRHGRMATYFNRLDRTLMDRISKTFGFHKDLESIKTGTS